MTRRRDPKLETLREQGVLNTRANRISDPLFGEHDFFDSRDLVQVKYEMLRRVEVDGQPVAHTAATFSFSRPSFYQAQEVFQRDGLAGLLPKKRGPRGAHKLRDEVVSFLRQLRAADPSLRAPELALKVEQRFGIQVHARSIERALGRQEKKRQR